MTNIPISKDGGVEPHMIRCSICKGDNGLSIGVMMQAEFQKHIIYCSRGEQSKINKQVKEKLIWTHVPADQTYITVGVCDKCIQEEKDTFKAELENGGVYFKCKECGATGMLKGDTQIAQIVREQADVKAPEPCGFEFDNCVQHGGKKDE